MIKKTLGDRRSSIEIDSAVLIENQNYYLTIRFSNWEAIGRLQREIRIPLFFATRFRRNERRVYVLFFLAKVTN